MRLLNFVAFFFALTSAFLLYAVNYETRRLEAEVQAKERAVAKAKSDIAVLRAERGHLSRPDRIDPLARQLGLRPPRPDQLTPPELASISADTSPALRRSAEGR